MDVDHLLSLFEPISSDHYIDECDLIKTLLVGTLKNHKYHDAERSPYIYTVGEHPLLSYPSNPSCFVGQMLSSLTCLDEVSFLCGVFFRDRGLSHYAGGVFSGSPLMLAAAWLCSLVPAGVQTLAATVLFSVLDVASGLLLRAICQRAVAVESGHW